MSVRLWTEVGIPEKLDLKRAQPLASLYFDIFLSESILARLHWKRWFVGLVGPVCSTAGGVYASLGQLFLLASALARTRPNFAGRSDFLAVVGDAMCERVESAAALDFWSLYPELGRQILIAANLPSRTVDRAMESESGQILLAGTKVPQSTAFQFATAKVVEGLALGSTSPELVTQVANQSLADSELLGQSGVIVSTVPDLDAEELAFLSQWEVVRQVASP